MKTVLQTKTKTTCTLDELIQLAAEAIRFRMELLDTDPVLFDITDLPKAGAAVPEKEPPPEYAIYEVPTRVGSEFQVTFRGDLVGRFNSIRSAIHYIEEREE